VTSVAASDEVADSATAIAAIESFLNILRSSPPLLG
jgi:hypothetical protein